VQDGARPAPLRPGHGLMAAFVGLLLIVAPAVGARLAREPGPVSAFAAQLDAELRPAAPGPAGTPEQVQARARALQVAALGEARAAWAAGDEARGRALSTQLYVHAADPAVRAAALQLFLDGHFSRWPEGYRAGFLARLSPAVIEAAREHHIPPSVALAQAVIESGWGRSSLARRHHNYFGVKGGGAHNGVRLSSKEFRRGKLRGSRDTWRRYESADAAVEHHARLLGKDGRYRNARPHWTDWRAFLDAIAPRYASSPTYARTVASVVEAYDLHELDALIVGAVHHDELVIAAADALDDAG